MSARPAAKRPTMEEYDQRVAWDAATQIRACREILAHHGLGAEVADQIDWIYRPALEDQEYRVNQLGGDAP